MKTYLTRLLAGVLLAGLIPVSTFAAGYHRSGVTGEVVLYHCAVEYPGADCYDPYQASIAVTTESGRFVTRATSDQSGHFRVFLKPGDYVLTGDAGDNPYPYTKPVAVHVDRGRFTPVTIVYDSGMR